MTANDPFTPIRRRLLAVLDNRPDAIVPALAKRIVAASGWILPDMSVNAIEEVMVDLMALSDTAAEYGRPDITDELMDIEDSLCAELPQRTSPAKPNNCRIGINFHSGSIGGGCSGCTAADVADALSAIVAELQMMDTTPDYIAYTDKGVAVEEGGCAS